MTGPESFPSVSMKEKATHLSNPSVRAITGRTIRHWTTSSPEFVGGSQRPSPALPYSERPDGPQSQLLASKLGQFRKAELARRAG